MPDNGAGTYSLPQSPFVSATTISSSAINSDFSDIATALNNRLARNGENSPTTNLPMAGYRHTGVGDGVSRTDYATLGQVQANSAAWAGTSTGSANAQAISPSPGIAAYAAGQRFAFLAGYTSSAAATLAVSGLTAKSVVQADGSALGAVGLQSGTLAEVLYDGTSFRLVAPGPGAALKVATVDATGAITAGGAVTAGTSLQVAGYAASPSYLLSLYALGTAAAPTVVNTASVTSFYRSRGYDGATYRDVAGFDIATDGAVSSTSSPGSLRFSTTPSGSVALTERMRIASTGAITTGSVIGSPAAGYTAAGDMTLPATGGVRAKNTVKAWVEFSGLAGAVIRDSWNVSSVTYNGTGDYTVNFTNAMTNTAYAVLATGGGNNGSGAVKNGDEVTARTTAAVRIYALNSTGTAVADQDRIAIAIYGA